MLGHSTHTIWADMTTNLFEYFMNFDEINEKLQKNQGIIFTKLPISQSIATLE